MRFLVACDLGCDQIAADIGEFRGKALRHTEDIRYGHNAAGREQQ